MPSGYFQCTMTEPARLDWIGLVGSDLGQPHSAYPWIILKHFSLSQTITRAPNVWEPLQKCTILHYRAVCIHLFHKINTCLICPYCHALPMAFPFCNLKWTSGCREQVLEGSLPQNYSAILGKLICDKFPSAHIYTFKLKCTYLLHSEKLLVAIASA